MADPNTRQGKRTPVTLKIKFKSETLEQFIERYAVDVSQGGIFIRTKDPLAVGTQMKFEFQLRDASPLIAGEGTVVWTRENDPSRPAIAPGMGVRFDRLAEGSQSVLERILAEKAKQAPQRGGGTETTKPPLFTDTPTRVAPAPIQDQLASGRTRSDSELTPLPKPMPFHSDADEFGAEAFEEATKVRQLDELVAATAAEEVRSPADELALRRPREQATVIPGVGPADERDSAPALPSAPESGNTGRTGKLLDTSPSPRQQTPSQPMPPLRPSQPPQPALIVDDHGAGRTRLGVEPAKVRPTERSTPLSMPSDPTVPTSRPSAAPVVIGVLVIVAAAIAAVWYFVLRNQVTEVVAAKAEPVTGSAVMGSALDVQPGSAIGSAIGSATPTAATIDTEIASNVAKATATVVDTGDTGPVPFKAKLEKDKHYKVRVEAPGYTTAELDVRGGQDKATAMLVAKPHVLSVKSEPAGAQIYIDSAGTGRVTPFDVALTAAQAAKPKLHITLRKSGYKASDQMIDSSAFGDEDKRVVAAVDLKLYPAPVITTTNTSGTSGTHTGSGATGSGSTPPDAGDTGTTPGSAAPLSGTGSATSSASGSGEPEPDFVKKP